MNIKSFRDNFIWIFPPALLLLSVLYGAIEVFGDRTIATVAPLSMIPNPVVPGTTATVVYQGKENGGCDGVVHRWMFDAKGVVFPLDDTSVFHHGSNDDMKKVYTFTRRVPIPKEMASGTSEYFEQAVRWCNGFQQLLYPVHDDYRISFEVGK